MFSYYEWALKYALKVGDIGSQVQLLCSLGDACLETGRMPEAVQYYNQGSATVKETGYKKYEFAPLYGLARIDRINGKPAESYRRMEQSLSIARAMKDRKREILCLMELGAILTDRGEHRAAILKLEQALDLIQQTRNKELVSECEGRIGISHECMGEYQEASEHYDRALKSARDVGNQSQEARWLSYYGYNYQHLPDGNNITAVELTEWAVEIAEKTQNEALRHQCAEKYQAARSQRNN